MCYSLYDWDLDNQDYQTCTVVGAEALGSDTHRLIVIAHRGASGLRPEHTLAAYELAIRQGADLRSIYGRLVDLVEGGITPTTGYRSLITPAVIEFLAATYAKGVGPWKNSILLREPLPSPIDGNGDGVAEITSRLTGEVAPFLSTAINAGLLVHPYTLRAEERFLTTHPNGVPQSMLGEVLQLLNLGGHGFFTDQPVVGVAGRTLFLRLNSGV